MLMFSLLNGTQDMNPVYGIGFNFYTVHTMEPRFGSGSQFIALTLITEHKRETEQIRTVECTGFCAAGYRATSSIFIFGILPSYSSNNKANWQLRKREKANNLFLICLGLHPRFWGSLRAAFSKQALSFKITLR